MSYSATLILNIDDNDAARYIKTGILAGAGFKVAEASNGTDGLALARQLMPALVLLDVKLPDISGIEVCRRIKTDPATSSLLVLQLSAALTERSDKIRGLAGGADNYLAAPIEADELLANVVALLRLRQTQVELRNSEERFRQLAENIEDVFWIFSLEQPGLVYVSAAYDSLWGRPRARLEQRPDDWTEAIHPDDRAGVLRRWAALRDGAPYDHEFRVGPHDSLRWVRDRAFLVDDTDGVPYRIARTSSDITRRKDLESQLRTADDNKNKFLATLAHELRNPLSPIRNAVALMDRAEADPGKPAQPTVLAGARQVIKRQVGHLARLVDDLLDVARISENKLILQTERIELRAMLAPALEAAAPILEARGHVLETLLPDAPVWLHGDPVRLAQVVGNLLHNAAKFTDPHGAITLRVSLPEPAQGQPACLCIAVSDNGIGIAPDSMPQIFTLFAQGRTAHEGAHDRAHDGLGIGLSLVSTLVRMHGGTVTAASAGTGQGSTFTVELPLAQAAQAGGQAGRLPDGLAGGLPEKPADSLTATTPSPTGATGGATLLLVDDNVDSAEVMAHLLTALGHRVHCANDAAGAMVLARQYRPDAIVLDIGMPHVDGYQLARQLRADPAFATTRLVAHTGYGALQDRQRSKEAGFDFHLVKPASLDELQRSLALD